MQIFKSHSSHKLLSYYKDYLKIFYSHDSCAVVRLPGLLVIFIQPLK